MAGYLNCGFVRLGLRACGVVPPNNPSYLFLRVQRSGNDVQKFFRLGLELMFVEATCTGRGWDNIDEPLYQTVVIYNDSAMSAAIEVPCTDSVSLMMLCRGSSSGSFSASWVL